MSAQVVIVSPALADANNGNWQTARRWQRFLAPRYPARIVRAWPDAAAAGDRIMLALHARRSASSIAAWYQAHAARLAVILTGTDLYRDIQTDAAAQASLRFAQALVVLQECGSQALPADLHEKTRVIFQSTTTRRQLLKPTRHLRALMVGHLREEKSPDTLFAAARRLVQHHDILIDHIGDPLDPELGVAAQATAANCPHYRWLGGLPHVATRRRIQQAHVLVHASRMEGGAHVVMEAIASGTPVLASRIDGNVGMLGADYAGYFAWGDAHQLAALLVQCRTSQHEPDGLLAQLADQCRQRAPLFIPALERSAVQGLVGDLLQLQQIQRM
jgi:putative glycosyltransferase (TIGR04348 family)